VVVEMKVVRAAQAAPPSEPDAVAARVLVSLAMCGIELYSLMRDATNPHPCLQVS
jgi:hypothetical protein